MKYLKPLAAASLGLGAGLGRKAVVGPAGTFQCSDGCGLPGVLNIDPRGVVGPDATDPALRVGRWPWTVCILCVSDATGEGMIASGLIVAGG